MFKSSECVTRPQRTGGDDCRRAGKLDGFCLNAVTVEIRGVFKSSRDILISILSAFLRDLCVSAFKNTHPLFSHDLQYTSHFTLPRSRWPAWPAASSA